MREVVENGKLFMTIFLLFGLISASFVIGSGTPGTWKEARGSNSYGSSSIECTAKGRYDNTGNYFDYAFHWGSGSVGPWAVCSQLYMIVESNSYSFTHDLRQYNSWSWAYSTPVSQATYVRTKVHMEIYLAGYPPIVDYDCFAQVTP
jgi:hypothetical protein